MAAFSSLRSSNGAASEAEHRARPVARDAELDKIPVPVIGFPKVGAGADARMQAEMSTEGKEKVRKVAFEERPYFYPRRNKSRDVIRKKRKTRHPLNKAPVQF